MEAAVDSTAIIGKIEEKALQLSGTLRVLDNHPVAVSQEEAEFLDKVLTQLQVRVEATRALCHSRVMVAA